VVFGKVSTRARVMAHEVVWAATSEEHRSRRDRSRRAPRRVHTCLPRPRGKTRLREPLFQY
jgi:hypothetical protein